MICVLDKLLVINNPKEYGWIKTLDDGTKVESVEPFFINSGEKTLLWFIGVMLRNFRNPLSVWFDFMKYVKKYPEIIEK